MKKIKKTEEQIEKEISLILKNFTFGTCDLEEFITAEDLIEQIQDITDEYDLCRICFEAVEEARGFEVEIIYYYKAMQYLSENDPSLYESLEIASEFGYKTENLHSELLASLHATKQCEEEYNDQEDDLKEILPLLEELKQIKKEEQIF